MAADYDAPRPTDDDGAMDTLVMPRSNPTAASADVSDLDAVEGLEIVSDGYGDVEVEVVVVPLQSNEFVCTECFLMVDRLQLHHTGKHGAVCNDCAA